MTPTVLHYIICDRVRADPLNLHRIDVEGIRSSLRSKHLPPFPLKVPVLTTLAVFMGGIGVGELSTRIIDDLSGHLVSGSKEPRPIKFVGDPFAVKGVRILVPNCTFPREGLYWVKLVFSGDVIASQPLRVYS